MTTTRVVRVAIFCGLAWLASAPPLAAQDEYSGDGFADGGAPDGGQPQSNPSSPSNPSNPSKKPSSPSAPANPSAPSSSNSVFSPKANGSGAASVGANSVAKNNGSQISFNASCIANMENGGHVFQQGPRGTNMFVLKDSSGQKLAVAYLSLAWLQRAQVTQGSSAYGNVKVFSDKVDWVNPAVIGGTMTATSGKMDLCMRADFSQAPDASTCRPLSEIPFGVKPGAGDPERPFQVTDIDVNFTMQVAGDKVTIAINNDNLVLSCNHPLYVPFLQGAPATAAGANLTRATFAGQNKVFKDAQSPLVIDIDNTGKIDLTNVMKKEVHFDADGTGNKIRTGWVGSKAAFLVIDANNDGSIASGRQLFGEFTDAVFDAERQSWFRRFYNGFQALAQYDLKQRGKIDASDAVWPKLRLWRDKNADAVSTPDELTTLDQAGIKSIDLAYEKTSNSKDYPEVEGNQIRFTSKATMKDGTTRLIGDVWFQYLRNVSSVPASAVALKKAE